MTKMTMGLIAGLAFGAVAVATMLPMKFPDKQTAMTAAFIERFGIGFVVAQVQMPWPGWLTGLVLGVLLSLPSALITKAYGPILGMGAVGGLIIGGLVHGWSKGPVFHI
jgi:hypothetical protein